jgi:rsbT co-antagonist protein RsbR
MEPLSMVAAYLSKNAKHLANEMVDAISKKFNFEVSASELVDAKAMYVEFLGFLALSFNCDEGSVPEELLSWSKENGERAAALHGKISDIIIRYPETRIVFTDYFLQIGVEHDLTSGEIVLILKRVNHMLDISINETVFAFERRTDEIIKKAQEEINELASPIVPIQEGLGVLPLIGSIDADRAEHLLNKVIPNIPSHQIESLIIDFSGIVTIDTDVASHIFNINNVLRLLGIHVIFTGIRPEIAARVIGSGIDFSSYEIFANVKQAIDGTRN